MDQSEKFWDRLAERYSKRPVADEATYQKKLQTTREYFRPDMNVLEIGCGTGSTAIAHAPFVKHIRAVDISTNMLDIARHKAEAQSVDNVTFERSGIDELDIPDQSLDAVLALSFLHLVDSREDVIAGVYDMLKDGGIFVSSTICLGDNLRFFKVIAPIGRFLRVLPTLKVFTTVELVDSLTDAGFRIDHQSRPEKGKAAFIIATKQLQPP